MTWHCEQHGEQIPQHNGTSYRCPLCTARVVWRDKRRESADDIQLRYLWGPWHYEHCAATKARALVRFDRAILLAEKAEGES